MSARPKVLGAAIAACGALLVVLPALPWYGAALPTGSASLSGYGAGGASWILPVIGVALAATGLLCAWWSPAPGTRTSRVLGGVTILWAGLGVVWAALVALAPRVEVVAERAGLPSSPVSGDWSVTVLPPAWVCLAAAALAGMAGILLVAASAVGEMPPDGD